MDRCRSLGEPFDPDAAAAAGATGCNWTLLPWFCDGHHAPLLPAEQVVSLVHGPEHLCQLGNGTLTATNRPALIVSNSVTAIAAGAFHSLFLKADGSLWVMGRNDSGQLGTGIFNDTAPYGITRPVQIVAGGVTAIAGGYGHGLFVKSDGSLWSTGDNEYGQLGDGTYSDVDPFGTNRPEQVAGLTLITNLKLTKTNLTLKAICGVSGTTNYLLTSTNVAQSRNLWARVQTNILTVSGGFTFTNTVDTSAPKSFYLIQTQ